MSGDGTAGAPLQATVIPGCGIQVDSTGVKANVGAWPFACDITTHGVDVYCDPSNGQLRTNPEHKSSMANAATVNVSNATLAPGQSRTIYVSVTVDGSDWCEDGMVMYFPQQNVFVRPDLGTTWHTFGDFGVDAPPAPNGNLGAAREYSLMQSNNTEGLKLTDNIIPLLHPAGSTHTYYYGLTVANFGPAGTGNVSVDIQIAFLAVLWFTNHP